MQAGFSAWWFDADLAVARKRYLERDGDEKTLGCFDTQAQRLRDSTAAIDALYDGKRIVTLNAQGYIGVEQVFDYIQNVEQTDEA
jgi:hypothetical protein